MKRTLAASGVFALFLVFGGLFISLIRIIPAGVPRTLAVLGFGILFVAVFVWLLVSHVQSLLAARGTMWKHLLLIAVNVVLLLLAFATTYQKLGIQDNTQSPATVSHDFANSVYYSIVTFTTLGYGDFYPTGLARPLAALQALTGYLVLGILASVVVSILDPREDLGIEDEDDDA